MKLRSRTKLTCRYSVEARIVRFSVFLARWHITCGCQIQGTNDFGFSCIDRHSRLRQKSHPEGESS